MEGGDGMVAVVRGLRDAGLAVTLLDGCRRYTLAPNSVPRPPVPTEIHVTRQIPECLHVMSDGGTEPPLRCESSAQATDGRYASIYKTAHCNLAPTSPPVQVTEFPPQRAELCPGHGNFEVGGTGSGEKYTPVKPTTQFRGGLSWPDRGSVCVPRPSYEPDSFANSLRKYPNMSQRSSEMVERLVNYTLPKYSSKNTPRSRTSPTRLCECGSNHNYDFDSRLPTRHRGYEPEVILRTKAKTDESPTREGRPRRFENCPDLSGTLFCKNYEVRCLRDPSKRTRDNVKNSLGQLSNHPGYLNDMERCDQLCDEPQSLPQRSVLRPNKNSVNTEIQAVVQMMSREVATLPRIEPSKRSVAVPISPISSATYAGQDQVRSQLKVYPTLSAFKSVQTIPINMASKTRKSVQATSSSIELLTVNRWRYSDPSERRSRSQEELTRRDDFRKEILKILDSIDDQSDEMYRAFRDEFIRKIKKTKRKIRFGMDGLSKSSPYWFKATCRHCADNCRNTKLDVFRADTKTVGVPNDDSLQNVIKDWLHEIQMKNLKVFEGHSLDPIVTSLVSKLRDTCINSEEISKSQIMQIIEEVTFDASDNDRNVQMNNLAEALAKKIKEVVYSRAKINYTHKKRERNDRNKRSDYYCFKKFIQPTEEEVRGFVREELLLFIDKFNLKLNTFSISELETEVIDVLIDSINELQWGDNDKVKEELAIALEESSKLPAYYLKCLADALVKRFKEFMHTFNNINMDKVERQTYVVLQNTIQNASKQQNETITDADIETHIEEYTSQLTQVIESWWTSILGADENEKGFREVAINDLAGDRVDRHRFLEMDTSKRWSNEEEVEYLKYQIFRWINKLVGDEAMQQAQDRASELMEQIRRIPVPMMKMPNGVAKPKINQAEHSRSPVAERKAVKDPTKPSHEVKQLPMFGSPGQGGSMYGGSKNPASARRMSSPASYTTGPAQNSRGLSSKASPGRRFSLQAKPTMHEVNQDMDSYIRDWVKQIPITANNPQDQEVAEKLRDKIYCGVWKALAKMEMDSATIRNEFYFRDRFDDELEQLLSSLPQSPELTSQKASLKAELIERTKNTVNVVRIADKSGSYKHRLLNVITNNLPPRPKVDDRNKSNAHLFEELLKLNLAEDFLLFTLYKNTYKCKGEAYRKKVLIQLSSLYENAKALPGVQLINQDLEKFSFNIFLAMSNVEEPTNECLQDEADQIILGHEIAQWLQDLPILQSEASEHADQLQRRRLRDTLAKKINDIEKQTNLCDSSAVRQLKNELSKFVEKFCPRPEEAGNLSFLIDEFINRLKNRRHEIQEPIEFGWFKHNLVFSSSFAEDIGQVGGNKKVAFMAQQAPPAAGGSHSLSAEYIPQQYPPKEPSDVEWLTLLTTRERLEREREEKLKEAQQPEVPPCCQPVVVGPAPYQEPSGEKWFTLLNTQEQIEREREKGKKVPPCCQLEVPSQREHSLVRPAVMYESMIDDEEIGLHTSQIAGPSSAPVVPQRVVAPPVAASTHSEMRRLVDLQDQRRSMMPNVVPPPTSGGVSFVQPVMQVPVTGDGVSGTSRIPGPYLPGANDAGCVQGTPILQRSVRPRQIGSPQQVLSSRSPVNQSQYQLAAPLAHQDPGFASRHGLQGIAEQNLSRPALSPMDMSIREPIGFSTPRQAPPPPARGAGREMLGAPRARRKRAREDEGVRPQPPRRRLDVEELEEEEEERERDEVQCRCTERVYRCRRRRPMCCDCEEMDYPRYYPMPYPYCFF